VKPSLPQIALNTGETLCISEAIKMETVLRAERDVTVGKINVKAGDSIAVDAAINWILV